MMVNSYMQVCDWDQKQCEDYVRQLEKTHAVKKTITRYTDEIDQVVNAILYAEQRIEEILTSEAALRGVETRNITMKVLPAIMTPKGRAENLKAAAELMGYKPNTIHTYLNNKPNEYYRCE